MIFALLTNVLVSRRIEQSLGQGSIRGMDGHVVLVGLGAVGLRVLEGLRALGRDVVVVEYDERNRYVQHARSLGVPVVHGDATLGQTLRSVNIAEAGAVAILTSDDLVNLETGLAVRDELGGALERGAGRAPRVRPRARQPPGEDVPVPPRLVDLGAGGAVVRRRGARPGDPRDVLRAQPAVPGRAPRRSPTDGGLVGLAMHELGARIRVVAIARGGGTDLEHPPRRDTRFAAGDQAYLVGPYEELLRVLGRERTDTPA